MATNERQTEIDRLVKLWPSVQLISQGHTCHCEQARQYWATLEKRVVFAENRLPAICWCPACGFTNKCSVSILRFVENLKWVNPERITS